MESKHSESEPTEAVRSEKEPVALQLVDEKAPYREAAASWMVPDVQLQCEDRYASFDLKSVSHVVLQISLGRQQRVFTQIGVKYDWNFPFPFWFFLGKMLSKALFGDDSLLEILNCVHMKQYEFVGYVNKDRVVDDDKDIETVKVIDVYIKRPQPGQPIQIFWKPARGIVVQKIEQWVKERRSLSTGRVCERYAAQLIIQNLMNMPSCFQTGVAGTAWTLLQHPCLQLLNLIGLNLLAATGNHIIQSALTTAPSTMAAAPEAGKPPGNLDYFRIHSHVPPDTPFPYPLDKSPIVPSTKDADDDWFIASRNVEIFMEKFEPPISHVLLGRKKEHLQYYFWTALDRNNRAHGGRQWDFHDMHGMLTCSPWFDCPVFDDLLWEDVKLKNGKIMKKHREPRSAEMEEAFLDTWCYQASQLRMRRFPNGDVVLPITAPYFRSVYGEEAMKWSLEKVVEDSEE
ncbi:hypothetical protein NM208_g13152 [Fusarium decemcellulare]|uniref:Uncharacterized protein n=1 Tax=Fusarium decemcellulare TaxID=57161 RepID=A0ACC1RMT9_9HYPO|nr:hypothetical protein NM208_g13152 [Fusarium decemcellulare]